MQVSQLIFKINTSNGSGSAFYLKQYNLFVTNFHVVQGSKTVAIENKNHERFIGHVIMVDANEDIALVKAEADFSILSEAGFSSLSQLSVRDEVYVLGFPYGMPYTETRGIISSPRQLMNGKYYIQTDAPVNPGNSGGPLVNKAGEIIGITTSKFTEADNMGFAVPVDTLLEILDIYTAQIPTQYSMVCPGCKSIEQDSNEYCNNCGGTIDTTLFEEKDLSVFAKLVEDGFTKHGINPVLARTGYEYWSFHNGSALVRIFIYNSNYVYATSPINKMMSKNMPELLRFLLSPSQQPYKLGVYDGEVFLSYRIHMSDLFSEKHGEQELERLIKLSEKADKMDHYLLEHFGCPLSAEAKVA